MKWLNRILLACLVAGGFALWPHAVTGTSTRDDLVRVRNERAKLRGSNAELAREVAALKAEIEALQSDRTEVARIAREDLNLVFPGEVVFEVEHVQEDET